MAHSLPCRVQVDYLADHPEHLPTIAAWVFQQWGQHRPGNSVEHTIERYRAYMQRGALPLTMVAVSGDNVPLGTASLWVHDMHTRMDLTPWLASVYVAPEQRQRGVGSALVQAVEGVARTLGIERLYLFTPDRERFYARLGWQPMERTEYRDEQVVIMYKALNEINGGNA